MSRWITLLCLPLLGLPVSAQCDGCFYQGPFSMPEIKIMTGDNPTWADPGFDDRDWPRFTVDRLKEIHGVYWVRAWLHIEDFIRAPGLAYELELRMLASFEIYMDGQLIGTSGRVGNTKAEEIPGPARNFFPLPRHILEKEKSLVALRLSSWHRVSPDRLFFDPFNRLAFNGVFQRIEIDEATAEARALDLDDILEMLLLCVPGIIALYFLFSFLGNRSGKHLLTFSLLCFSLTSLGLADLFGWGVLHAYKWYAVQWWAIFLSILAIAFLFPIYFLQKFKLSHPWIWLTGIIAIGLVSAALAQASLFNGQHGKLVLLEILVGILLIHGAAWFNGRHDVWPTGVCVLFSCISLFFGVGYFFASLALLMAVVLWQLAREQRIQRRNYILSQVNSSRLESALLRKHIQPHFLMNSLTSLMEWVEVDPERGAEFIEALGHEFRLLTQIADQPLIPFSKEIEICRRHLEVMGFRLQKQFHLKLSGIMEHETIPPAIFLTLAENGISHNRYREPEITFSLTREQVGKARRYTFTTPFTGRAKHPFNGNGTGLKYIQAQLSQTYPDRWRLSSGPNENTWQTKIELKQENNRSGL